VIEHGLYGEIYEARLARAIELIDRNPSKRLSLETLASIACLSPFHFHRIFRAITGESVRTFVERRRLEQAIALAKKGQSWKSAALACGFGSPISFARAFKRVFGVPPSQFEISDWWQQRHDREVAFGLSSHFLRPALPVDTEFKVEILERPFARLAVSRVWGGYLHPERLVATYTRLRDWAGKNALDVQSGKISGASQDDPDLTPLSRCRYDFQIELSDQISLPSQFSIRHREAGLWAVLPVTGRLENVDRAWSMLFKSWLPASGLDLRDAPAEEVYLRLPEDIGWEQFDLLCCVPVSQPRS
jgi:AraC family transcriptional regulator